MIIGLLIGLILISMFLYISNTDSTLHQAIGRVIALLIFFPSTSALIGLLIEVYSK